MRSGQRENIPPNPVIKKSLIMIAHCLSCRPTRPSTTPRRPLRARLELEALERREVLSTVAAAAGGPTRPPDNAGGTLATARAISLIDFQPQSVTDYLPNATDVDLYRIQLNKGDFLAVDVAPTSSVALNNSLAILNASGAVVAGSLTAPPAGRPGVNAPFGYYATAVGTYYVRLQTAAAANAQRGYTLGLEQVARQDGNQSAQTLWQGGASHAWLNKAGDTLYVTGPTGYGFALLGNWQKSQTGATVSYAASGTLQLQTTALDGTVGEVALQVPQKQTFTVTTNVPGRIQLGELSSVSGHFGLSLKPLAADVSRLFHFDISATTLLADWTIKTGSQIKHDYNNFMGQDINQVLNGVPYLVYGDPGSVKVNFGKVNFTSDGQGSVVILADPADPFLYVDYKTYAAAGSAHGRIPFNTTAVLPALSVPGGPSNTGGPFGQVYAAGDFPVFTYGDPSKAAVQITVAGEVTVDLDANHDGQFLGGAGTASQFLHGDLSTIPSVLADINVGSNGQGTIHLKAAGVDGHAQQVGYDLAIPVAKASVLYSSSQHGLAFKSVDGTALNVWKNTPLRDFESGPGTTFQGYVLGNGKFSVSTTGSYQLFTRVASLTVTANDQGLSASGTVIIPVGVATVGGAVFSNGDFTWGGQIVINVGNNDNYLRGSGGVSLSKTGSQMTFNINAQAQAQLTLGHVARVKGAANGALTVVVSRTGGLAYSTGLQFNGEFDGWEPIFARWAKLGEFSGAFHLQGSVLSLNARGKTLSLNLS